METVTLIVHGDCQPSGSKKAFVNPKTGRAIVVDANNKAKGWKERIAKVCAEQYGGPFLEGALVATIRFYQVRPQGHYGSGRNAGLLKDSAPAQPTVAPDVDKFARAVFDGLQGQLYRNDAQCVRLLAEKHYGEPARVEIEVAEAREQTVGDMLRPSLVAA
jgi:Holliday junction resolvase RusA-like endonuclease